MEEEPTIYEIPQQPVLQPSKRKLTKKVVSLVLIGVVLCSILGTLGYFYWNLNNQYESLKLEYARLQSSNDQLSSDHQGLEQNYGDLNVMYNDLNAQYQSLFTDYDALNHVFSEPLINKKVPTIEELQQWLSEDKTDEIQYDYPHFICGDFAVMLSQHAKLKNWDMGIVAVYGYDENYEPYGHALNAIITTEGLRYVEPQDDYFWHFTDGLPMLENRWNEIGRDRTNIYVEDCKIIVRYE